MSVAGRLFAWFPTLHLALIATALGWAVVRPGLVSLLTIAAVTYGLPVLLFRVHNWLAPLRPGISDLAVPTHSAWWGAHQLQRNFVAFPALEAALRTVPGLFSAWLRLWGSEVGRNVIFTPQLDLLDRTHLSIGDGVLFGHRVTLACHVVHPRGDRLLLYVAPITIGEGAFIGAGSVLGPGVTIEANAILPAGTVARPRRRIGS
jgi:hypothetical protein